MFKDTFSLTFAERVENHVGMQMIGKDIDTGLGKEEFNQCIKVWEYNNLKYEMIDLLDLLTEEQKNEIIKQEKVLPYARVLVLRNALDSIFEKGTADEMYQEQKQCPYDSKAWMRGAVKNKNARWNSCYADFDQEPDYENKKGTIVNFTRVPCLDELRKTIPMLFGKRTENLFAEMNYYYDTKKCYIGNHGDAERKMVICARLGADFPLYFSWFYRFKQISKRIKIELFHGDMYAMSFKATGNDWKKSSKYTLRHAAAANEKLIK